MFLFMEGKRVPKIHVTVLRLGIKGYFGRRMVVTLVVVSQNIYIRRVIKLNIIKGCQNIHYFDDMSFHRTDIYSAPTT